MSHRFEIRHADERFDVLLDGQHLIQANHDEHGWDGMGAVRKVVDGVARIIGAEIVEVDAVKTDE